ncbi:DUF6318 family protein [Actinobaculum suis]|uniref:DUF6318 family protein n=1 Tax=Actinobaculum suis TaxID=1657 RepID=UPI0012E1A71B|nr:DUF6318 family protein [Actinobaculum suis]
MKPRFVWRPAAWRYAALGLSILFVLPVLVGCGSTDSSPPSPTLTVVPPESLQTSDAAKKESVETSNDADSTTAVEKAGEAEKPVPPAAMENVDADGAIAAAEYFMNLTLYAVTTRDTTDLERMSSSACGWCQDQIRIAADPKITARPQELPVFIPNDKYGSYDEEVGDFLVWLTGHRSDVYTEDGQETGKGQYAEIAMSLIWDGDWIVQDMWIDAEAKAPEADG